MGSESGPTTLVIEASQATDTPLQHPNYGHRTTALRTQSDMATIDLHRAAREGEAELALSCCLLDLLEARADVVPRSLPPRAVPSRRTSSGRQPRAGQRQRLCKAPFCYSFQSLFHSHVVCAEDTLPPGIKGWKDTAAERSYLGLPGHRSGHPPAQPRSRSQRYPRMDSPHHRCQLWIRRDCVSVAWCGCVADGHQ